MLPRILTLITLAPLALVAQAGLTFTYQISGAAGVGTLAPGDTIVYPAIAAGSASQATIYCFNQSSSSYSVSASATNPLFATSSATVQLAPGSSTAVAVTFNPKAAGTATAGLNLILTPAAGTSRVVQFTLSAQALDGVLASVAFASDGNQSLVPDGGTIAFPATAPGSQSNATFTISNRSTASVSIGSLLLSGTAFHLSGLPLMPVALPAGGQISAGITFSPDQPGSLSGNLTYSVSGVTHSILLSGPAAASSLEFAVAGTGVLGSGATISFPSAAVGTPTALTLQVRNTGTAPATISNLVVSPSSFQLQNAPSLPLTIAANGSASLGLAFVPQAPGAITGALQIGGASFTLSGIGLGPQFTCMFTARGQTAPACTGSTISLPPVSLGDQLLFTVQVTNTGNQPGAIQNFAISGPGYSVAAAPSLPATLAAGDSIQVNASFAPTVLGIVGGYLQLNGQTYNLTVVVTAPPSLPAISITNLKPQMQALQQPLIGIHLAAPYPYDLTGRLTLSFTADSLIDDPAVQFLNGQRYVDFRVPAGSADAVFGTTATGVIFQTGSSAGAISLAASFTLGQYVLTGSSPVTQNVSIPAAAPQILSLQIGASDSAGFDLLITGVSTARSVTQLAFTLNPAKDSSLATPTLTADVSAAFNAWYQSALSRSYGGQFTVSVRFNVTGDITAIQGITATATNAQGTSDPQSIALPSSGTQ